jgi:hypothetical protein
VIGSDSQKIDQAASIDVDTDQMGSASVSVRHLMNVKAMQKQWVQNSIVNNLEIEKCNAMLELSIWLFGP